MGPVDEQGKPAAFGEPDGAAPIEARLASLIGLPAAVVATSTLHAFWDVFNVLDPARSAILVDAGAYPIAQWAAEHAQAKGATVGVTPRRDPVALRGQVRAATVEGRRPIVVADGFCPGCGNAAPVAAMLEEVARLDGLLVLDDTQAFGVLGLPDAGGGYGSVEAACCAGPGSSIPDVSGLLRRQSCSWRHWQRRSVSRWPSRAATTLLSDTSPAPRRASTAARRRSHAWPRQSTPSTATSSTATAVVDGSWTRQGLPVGNRRSGMVSLAPGLFPMQTVLGVAGRTSGTCARARGSGRSRRPPRFPRTRRPRAVTAVSSDP